MPKVRRKRSCQRMRGRGRVGLRGSTSRKVPVGKGMGSCFLLRERCRLGEYIDDYYNSKRRHSFIDYECPIGFELKSQLAAMAA